MPLAARDYRVNDQIRIREVRVIGDDGEQMGVMPTERAQEVAREAGLDLVEVAPSASPPVCRILDFGKFKYEQAKKKSEGRKKQRIVLLREVTMKPKIGQHDIDFKTRTACKLLGEGDKVKVTVMFRGREITHPEIGRELLQRVLQRIEETGIPLLIERPIGLEGRFMSVIVSEDRVRAAAVVRERERASAMADAEEGAESVPSEPVPTGAPEA